MKLIGIAATLTLLLGFGWYTFMKTDSINPQELYASNFELYPNTVYPITRGQGDDTIEHQAFMAYESDQHEEAITYFKTLKQGAPPNYIDFYMGLSYLKTGNHENAIKRFTEVIEQKGNFDHEARWYLALSYLANKDIDQAKDVLEILTKKGSYKNEEANIILRALERR
ncbi:tetratricopeptide repeat protein [Flavivirga jejuensis]|uniref:Tetratricopeptide repeat protein n=1 Tax=Flavivirga jejuensis TaxID=870487 RepID=A0ABT8WTN0_9FLAO|nr:tetratricopeptide repeat protein [Flavivirga jejuensis]MDO5976241.1 tetratricopeptide repeat protein [Flavivirga jejuensis]